jgi:glutathione-regulated potassium-efflux system ancillary protein KefC
MELSLITTAYAAGLIASLCRLPPLVGYLAAGYALAYVGVASSELVFRLADLGIELLLFTVGLKLQLASLVRREVLGVGGLHMLIVTVATGLGFLFLDKHITGGLLLGASLAFASTVLAVKALEDNDELSALHGRIAVGILILQDIVAVGLLAIAGAERLTLWALTFLLLPLFRPLAFRLFEASRGDELKLLFGIGLALSGGAGAKMVGISPDLGALLMGALLAGHPDSRALSDKLWGLKEAFLVAFFLEIGLAGIPTAEEFLIALKLLALLPIQCALFFFLFVLIGLRARTAFVTSLALTTYSEFALITAKAITGAGLLTPEWRTVMGVAVALSLALAAPLNRFSHRIFGRIKGFLIKFERTGRHPDSTPTSIGSAQWLIVGMGRMGAAAYDQLVRQGHRVLGLDADPICIETHREQGRRVLYGDAEDRELWNTLHLTGLRGVILTMPELEARRAAVAHLRANGFDGLIGTISYHPREDSLLTQAGTDAIFHPSTETGERLALRMLDLRHPGR